MKAMRWQMSPSQRRRSDVSAPVPVAETGVSGDSGDWKHTVVESEEEHGDGAQEMGMAEVQGEVGDTEMSVTAHSPEAAWNESYQSILEMEEHTFNMSGIVNALSS